MWWQCLHNAHTQPILRLIYALILEILNVNFLCLEICVFLHHLDLYLLLLANSIRRPSPSHNPGGWTSQLIPRRTRCDEVSSRPWSLSAHFYMPSRGCQSLLLNLNLTLSIAKIATVWQNLSCGCTSEPNPFISNQSRKSNSVGCPARSSQIWRTALLQHAPFHVTDMNTNYFDPSTDEQNQQ